MFDYILFQLLNKNRSLGSFIFSEVMQNYIFFQDDFFYCKQTIQQK